MSAVTLFMLRHGAHDAVHDVLCGRMEGVRLGRRGVDEAKALGQRLSSTRLAAVYASPVERARRTAEAVASAQGLKVEIDDALIEIDCGDWTGLRFSELANRPDWRRWNAEREASRPPNGESMGEAQARVTAWSQRLRARHAGGAVAAVSHGDVIKALIAAALDIPLDRHDRFEISPGSMTAILLHDAGETVIAMNEVPDQGGAA